MRLPSRLQAALALLPTLALLTGALQERKSTPQPPTVGEAAPTFRLNDHTGRPVTVGGADEDTQLWTVVAFYPKAMTPG